MIVKKSTTVSYLDLHIFLFCDTVLFDEFLAVHNNKYLLLFSIEKFKQSSFMKSITFKIIN